MDPRQSLRRSTDKKARISAVAVTVLITGLHLFSMLFTQSEEQRMLVTDSLSVLVSAMAVAALITATVSLRKISPRMSLVWGGFAVAQIFTLLGDGTWFHYEVILGIEPSPSSADIFYLLFYPSFLLSVLIIPARKSTLFEWAKAVLDIVIIFLAVTIGFWNFIFAPLSRLQTEVPQLDILISTAYPVGDLLLLWALLVVLYRPTRLRSSTPLWLMVVGNIMIILFDVLYAYQSMYDVYVSRAIIDPGYTLGNLLFGLAGTWQCFDARAGRKAWFDDTFTSVNRPLTGWLVYLPYVWVTLVYFLLLRRNYEVYSLGMLEFTFAVGVVIALVLIRQIVALRENSGLYSDLESAHRQLREQAKELEKANNEMELEITERKKIQEQLSYDALHDALTGLPNRTLFLDRLDLAIKKKHRYPDYHFAVLFLDLDSFKVINDSLGHVVGDRLLVRTGKILSDSVRDSDTVARLGGDEFVVLLERLAEEADAVQTADRLQTALSQPLDLEQTRVFVSVSIGIVQHVEEYDRAEDILRDADLAMYQAKSRGKSRHEVFVPSMRQVAISRLNLENDMRRGLVMGEFALYYQPILTLPDQQLVGMEALVRWMHPERGIVMPGEFIQVAEETGLILPLGRWILNEACRQAVIWQHEFTEAKPFKVSVNVSGKQLTQSNFVEMVVEALELSGLPNSSLALEVTESVCIEHMESIYGTLSALRDLGIEVQIDDFGTGYSSLSYLQRLPIRSIKVDRSFIETIQDGMKDTPDIVRAIFSMVNDLGIKAVAEGIENQTQLVELSRLRCDYVQGYFLATPMDEICASEWITKHTMTLEDVVEPKNLER